MLPLLPEVILPAAVVLTLGLLFPPRRQPGTFATTVMIAGLVYLVGRYFWWRLTETLYPVEGFSLLVLAIWLVLAIELMSWFDASILLAQLARRTDRTPEADSHEIRLRQLPVQDLPHVDVLIATYDEPIDVLERTIIGAMSLDWPADRLHIHVLDDGRRDWLAQYCQEKGINWITRSDNAHAKAGNINAALKITSSEFFLILDADFIPQRNMLYRMIGFFEDPEIGIVQAPHEFFNFDPLQTNLAMRSSLPSDQKMFFREIMRGRDGWDCAFCCGSNSITRRSAMDAIGGAMPTGSITEDMLLTLAFLRKGYKTRYLCERLAVGLAPESLDAFFVQRSRWAQGALQILYLREGPLGPGLSLAQRLLFMPTHWLTQSLMQVMALLLPVAFLLFEFVPMVLNDVSDLLYYQIPAIMVTIMVLRRLAPDAYFVIPTTILSTLQSFRFLPMLIKTLFKPHGHKFRVTPKGTNGTGQTFDRFTLTMCLALLWGTTLGFGYWMWAGATGYVNNQIGPIVAFWSIINAITLSGVLTVAFSRRVPRKEERFFLKSPVTMILQNGQRQEGRTLDVSLSGARIAADLTPKTWLVLQLTDGRPLLGYVRWCRNGTSGVEFCHIDADARDALIACIYTDCDDTIPTQDHPGNIFLGLLHSIFGKPKQVWTLSVADQVVASQNVLDWYQKAAPRLDPASQWSDDLDTEQTAPWDASGASLGPAV